MPPPRPSGSVPFPSARGSALTNTVPVYEVVKTRVLLKLHDRFDPAKARRMPAALFAEAARQQVEQVVEAEAARLPLKDRARLADDVFAEAFGYGPLEELFADPGVKEVTVLGAAAVIARRDQGWLPTNVKFRDEEHVVEVLEKARARGEAVGGPLPPSVLDAKLANGFRVVALIPPPALGQPPAATFVRAAETATPAPAVTLTGPPGSTPMLSLCNPGSQAVKPAGPVPTPPPSRAGENGSGWQLPPAPRSAAVRPAGAPGDHPLERHRVKVTERLIGKMARLGVYDLSRVDTPELRKVVAAYVTEYCEVEQVLLSEADQEQLTRLILAAMNR